VVAVTVPRKISTIEELVSKRRLQKQRPQSRETVMGLCPGKGGSWSSETNHDMRTALRPALFISKWSLHKQRPQSPKTILCSCAGEDGSSRSETKQDR
jgi:hypothetical protein